MSNNQATADILDDSLTAEDLAKLTAERRDLWGQILNHPNCYPKLAEYINKYAAQVNADLSISKTEKSVIKNTSDSTIGLAPESVLTQKPEATKEAVSEIKNTDKTSAIAQSQNTETQAPAEETVKPRSMRRAKPEETDALAELAKQAIADVLKDEKTRPAASHRAVQKICNTNLTTSLIPKTIETKLQTSALLIFSLMLLSSIFLPVTCGGSICVTYKEYKASDFGIVIFIISLIGIASIILRTTTNKLFTIIASMTIFVLNGILLINNLIQVIFANLAGAPFIVLPGLGTIIVTLCAVALIWINVRLLKINKS